MWPLKRGVLEPKYGGASAKQRSANSLKKTSMHRATIRYGPASISPADNRSSCVEAKA
jgi:hypothetical protein